MLLFYERAPDLSMAAIDKMQSSAPNCFEPDFMAASCLLSHPKAENFPLGNFVALTVSRKGSKVVSASSRMAKKRLISPRK